MISSIEIDNDEFLLTPYLYLFWSWISFYVVHCTNFCVLVHLEPQLIHYILFPIVGCGACAFYCWVFTTFDFCLLDTVDYGDVYLYNREWITIYLIKTIRVIFSYIANGIYTIFIIPTKYIYRCLFKNKVSKFLYKILVILFNFYIIFIFFNSLHVMYFSLFKVFRLDMLHYYNLHNAPLMLFLNAIVRNHWSTTIFASVAISIAFLIQYQTIIVINSKKNDFIINTDDKLLFEHSDFINDYEYEKNFPFFKKKYWWFPFSSPFRSNLINNKIFFLYNYFIKLKKKIKIYKFW